MNTGRFHFVATILFVCFAWSNLAGGQVIITEDTDEGIACFKVVTDSASYFFDKAGAGFTSIVDVDGIDWINFHPEGTEGIPNGQSGWYRGIPNMGLNAFGHPGYTGAQSTTDAPLAVSLNRASIRSIKGDWDVTWEFFANYAKMTVNSVPENYWFLYEGTPGGTVGGDDICMRSSGQSNSLDDPWEGDLENTSGRALGLEWVFFSDGTLDRSLFLAHDDDDLVDRYYLMNPMTVFGFGRHSEDLNRLMSETPARLYMGFVGSRGLETVLDAIEAAQSGVDIDAGTQDAGNDAGTPDASEDAGAADAGEDAGIQDAGNDAGTPDASEDAGRQDAGDDAGTPDAGEDAGEDEDACLYEGDCADLVGSCACGSKSDLTVGTLFLAMIVLVYKI